jgi:hypothetical protein
VTRIDPQPEVVVIRSGYATEALWRAAIAQALKHGREVRAIDEAGKVLARSSEVWLHLEPEPEAPDW